MKTILDLMEQLEENGSFKALVKIDCTKCGLIDYPTISYNRNNNGFKATCNSCHSYHSFLAHKNIGVRDEYRKIDKDFLY